MPKPGHQLWTNYRVSMIQSATEKCLLVPIPYCSFPIVCRIIIVENETCECWQIRSPALHPSPSEANKWNQRSSKISAPIRQPTFVTRTGLKTEDAHLSTTSQQLNPLLQSDQICMIGSNHKDHTTYPHTLNPSSSDCSRSTTEYFTTLSANFTNQSMPTAKSPTAQKQSKKCKWTYLIWVRHSCLVNAISTKSFCLWIGLETGVLSANRWKCRN